MRSTTPSTPRRRISTVLDGVGHGWRPRVCRPSPWRRTDTAGEPGSTSSQTYAAMDAAVAAHFGDELFVTAVLARLDPTTGAPHAGSTPATPAAPAARRPGPKVLDGGSATPLGLPMFGTEVVVHEEQLEPGRLAGPLHRRRHRGPPPRREPVGSRPASRKPSSRGGRTLAPRDPAAAAEDPPRRRRRRAARRRDRHAGRLARRGGAGAPPAERLSRTWPGPCGIPVWMPDLSRLETSAADVSGRLLSTVIRGVAAVRPPDKPLHPRGTVVRGRLDRHGSAEPSGVPLLDERRLDRRTRPALAGCRPPDLAARHPGSGAPDRPGRQPR